MPASRSNERESGEGRITALLRSICAFFSLNNYLWSLIYAPAAAQIILLGFVLIDDDTLRELLIFPLGFTAIAIAFMGYLRAKKLVVKDSYFRTYFALFLPLIVAAFNLSLWNVYNALDFIEFEFIYYEYFVVSSNITFIFSLFLFSFISSLDRMFAFTFTVYCAYAVGFCFGLHRKKQTIANKKPIYLSCVIAIFLFASSIALIVYKSFYMIADEVKEIEAHAINLFPDTGHKKTALRGDRELYFTSDFPRLDGATSFYPIYGAVAEALYQKPAVASSRTDGAYDNLINGEADLIVVFAPSPEQLARAEQAKAELVLTPIGKEAFVFLVNKENPIKSLTIEQIQKIYTGEITNWRDLGGEDEKIFAFQRDKNSGSQTAMENGVMKELTLKKPLMEEIHGLMSGLIDVVADYRNAQNAIGYSFRYFVTDMH
ncbi:MAG: substrate-binding domain-containing protein, partial [Helicobacteraceae bacterium]|nr:substrate-binding domain-containing protein [Helicobacteraceae bacterium]